MGGAYRAAGLSACLISGMAASACRPARVSAVPTAADGPTVVRLHVVLVSDDDGSRPVRVEIADIVRWVGYANRVFADAALRFELDPERDVERLNDHLINGALSSAQSQWRDIKRRGNDIAARHPGRIVLFFRHGPDEAPTGQGFSGSDLGFVVAPGSTDLPYCGGFHVELLAHELGHYLGLLHTFAGDPFADPAAAQAHFERHGREPAIFDGDGLSDTPPDPAVRSMECAEQDRLLLAGHEFVLPRRNLMSYYDNRDHLTPQQIARARWVLAMRMRSPRMRLPTNEGCGPIQEAELLEVVSLRDATSVVQPMAGFGAGDWSGDAQLLVRAGPRAELTFRLPAPAADPAMPIVLFATRAPDFGRIRVELDGRVLGDEIDLYAPVVTPTGPLVLGPVGRASDRSRLTIRASGRHPEATGTWFGIDGLSVGAQVRCPP